MPLRFDSSVGTKIRKSPAVIGISGTAFNRPNKITLIPLTTSQPQNRQLLSIVIPITPADANGLDVENFLICVAPMTFDKKRKNLYFAQIQ